MKFNIYSKLEHKQERKELKQGQECQKKSSVSLKSYFRNFWSSFRCLKQIFLKLVDKRFNLLFTSNY